MLRVMLSSPLHSTPLPLLPLLLASIVLHSVVRQCLHLRVDLTSGKRPPVAVAMGYRPLLHRPLLLLLLRVASHVVAILPVQRRLLPLPLPRVASRVVNAHRRPAREKARVAARVKTSPLRVVLHARHRQHHNLRRRRTKDFVTLVNWYVSKWSRSNAPATTRWRRNWSRSVHCEATWIRRTSVAVFTTLSTYSWPWVSSARSARLSPGSVCRRVVVPISIIFRCKKKSTVRHCCARSNNCRS
mmetsp:Transcript_5804/g.14754  ORF Transcript_5804/g.14754 Transcript_5804/m.14754 type:complete len:243 (-) Transcript_5804:433-1161(-)